MRKTILRYSKQNWPQVTITLAALILIFATLPFGEKGEHRMRKQEHTVAAYEKVQLPPVSPANNDRKKDSCSYRSITCTIDLRKSSFITIANTIAYRIGLLLFLFL